VTLRSLALRPLVLIPLALLLNGCALTSTGITTTALGLSLHGNVHGGQQPINGAHVYLFAASSAGYGTPSVSLLSSTGFADSLGSYVPTGADGSFSISNDYACTPNTQVYLYALGGDPGSGVNNSAAGLMAVLGSCPNDGSNSFAGSVPYVSINEVSTVAAAYAMAPYAVDATDVASSGTPLALTGIANAFANATLLADLPSGSSLATTPNGNGVVPQSAINTLANVIAACINTTGPADPNCIALLGAATSDGTMSGTAPSDTATAMINIAHNPGANTSALYNLPPAISPFAPTLANEPNDFTLAVSYTGTGFSNPGGVSIDAVGNAWVTNQSGNSITVLSSLGIPMTGSPFSGNGINYPSQLAIDNNGNAWVANLGNSSISEFDLNGNQVNGSPFSGDGSSALSAIAINSLGNVWIAAPYTNNLDLLTTTSGTPSPRSITGDGLSYPTAVASDNAGNTWIVNQLSNSVTILDNTQTPLSGSPFSSGDQFNNPSAVSIDGAGNAWISNPNNNSISVIGIAGTLALGSPFSAGGLANPICVAFDGAGNVWVANQFSNGVTALTSAGVAVTGSPFIPSAASNINNTFVAVDGSGSVWLTDLNNNSLTEIIGSAAPAVTPIATAMMNNTTGARP